MNYQERLFRMRHGWGCEPTTVIALSSLAISAAGATANGIAQSKAAKAQTKYQQDLVDANNATTIEEMGNAREGQSQARESAARDAEEARLANQKAQATATVAAGEAGVQGNSVDALMAQFSASEGRYKEALARQTKWIDRNADLQVQAASTGASYQNLNINAPVTKPTHLATALGVARDGLGIYRQYRADKRVTGEP